ncbi:MAG TPA: DNA repair protein RadC [Vicinamibacterales bacterium]|nr:DNA repair protein RadC [Vicinamibacterales bacterium]
MKAIRSHDRPREKLARAGAASLGDNELLAVLIGAGIRSRTALMVAQDVLEAVDGVAGLPRATLDDLRQVPGIGGPRAARLVAAVELGRRAVTSELGERPRLNTPTEVGRYLLPLYGGHREERFGVLMLNAKNRVIKTETLSVGSLDSSIAHPREIFRAAAMASAFAIAVFHNHPSGDPSPSPDDVALTAQLVRAGEVMGIPLLDHIILGEGRWFSFRAACLL